MISGFTYYLQKLDPSKLDSYHIAYICNQFPKDPQLQLLFPRAYLHPSELTEIFDNGIYTYNESNVQLTTAYQHSLEPDPDDPKVSMILLSL